MSMSLSDRKTPEELAARGQVIEFEEKLELFRRLAGIVEADLGRLDTDRIPRGWRSRPVAGRMAFGYEDAQAARPAVDGEVRATIDAVCQRCLEPFALSLEAGLGFRFDALDSDSHEAWEQDEPTIRPIDIVEEALIMAMPLAAKHPPGACSARVGGDGDEQRTTRPFANLKAQMEEQGK